MHACRAALFASALALSACDSDLPQTPTAPTVPLPGSVPVVNITISPVPVPARRTGKNNDATGNGVKNVAPTFDFDLFDEHPNGAFPDNIWRNNQGRANFR